MKLHLVTVIGAYVEILPHMLRHYRRMGIESFIINVHLQHPADPILNQVVSITEDFGCQISSVTVGRWSDEMNSELYASSRALNPNDWYIIADLDEFQVYPKSIHSIIEECEKKGYDYIEGYVVDRIAADGRLPDAVLNKPLEEQFPLGCIFTYAVLGGFPLKVVAAKGYIDLPPGNHYAKNGKGCPMEEYYIPVYHYKWLNGMISRIELRANDKLWPGKYKYECQRLVEYYHANNGRINISDPRLLVSKCDPQYEYWDLIKAMVVDYKSNISKHRANTS
jgi:Glycosyl transferase family 2